MDLFKNSQRRKPKRKDADRKQHKERVRIERAMRENGSLGRVTAAQAALRRQDIGREILLAIRMREHVGGPITRYEVLRELVITILTEAGVELEGVMLKFCFGPGCGTCNHVHEEAELCGWPGCDTDHKFTPGNILGISAAPTFETVQTAAAAACVALDPTRLF
jgi:hypothetical protein